LSRCTDDDAPRCTSKNASGRVLGAYRAARIVLDLGGLESREANAGLFHDIGIVGPLTAPVLGPVSAGGPGQRAGLREGDVVLQVGATAIVDGLQLREVIRASVSPSGPLAQTWRVRRGDSTIELSVTPEGRREGDKPVGRIGAYVGGPPQWVLVRHGPLDGLRLAAVRTWEVAGLTVNMMGRMITGQASLKNLASLTIADYASRPVGPTQYLVFRADQRRLGVLNLLPPPVPTADT
jgi:regulator of sigma E protease